MASIPSVRRARCSGDAAQLGEVLLIANGGDGQGPLGAQPIVRA